ncbi:methyl-accepting chemotaxis protein [Vibrio sp. WXL210]|uniref:methyl-accepting chemotaxis protein n=1 Tax=Vibrio sp. WXL210 TaxID=3450709 RepID=UPI003EC7AB57
MKQSLFVRMRKITGKLTMMILVSLIMILIIGYNGLAGLKTTSASLEAIVEQDMAKVLTFGEVQQAIERARVDTLIALQQSAAGEGFVATSLSEQLDEAYQDIEALLYDLTAFEMSTVMESQLSQVQSSVDTLFFSGLAGVSSHLHDEAIIAANQVMVESVNPQVESLRSMLNGLSNQSAVSAHDAYVQSTAHGDATMVRFMSALVLSALVLAGFAVITIRRIVVALAKLQSAADSIAGGNLTYRVKLDGEDEFTAIGRAVNEIAHSFQATVSLMGQSAQHLNQAATDNTQLSEQTADNATSQQEQIQQIATATEELTATVSDVAASALAASEASQQSDQLAQDGTAVVTEAIAQSIDLAAEIEKAKQVINELGQHSQDIGSVSDTIRSISEQTNLLALNAAIEAARAGNYGRGFAVVADEVRSLAQRTKDATEDIQETIARLQQGCDLAIERMDSGDEYARQSTIKTKKVGEALAAITHEVTSIAEKNIQIASAAEQQAVVTGDVNTNVYAINSLADKTVEDSCASQKSSQSISQLAQSLSSEIKRFTV